MAKAYLLDTNIFIQAKNLHYRFEFCGGFWKWIEDAYAKGVVYSIAKVRAELVAGKPDCPAKAWAEAMPKDFFLDDVTDAAVMDQYGKLMTWAATHKQYTPTAIAEFADGKRADAFIVAVARRHGHVVVTQEKSEPAARRKIPIPQAADAIGVSTMTIFDLLYKHAESTFSFKL